MKHNGTKVIETENLILRKFELSDANAVYNNWASDSDVTKYLTWGPMDNIDTSKMIVQSWVDEYKNADFYQWAIVLKANSDEPIGTISTVRQDEELGMVQIGYCLGKKWWNKGISSEALAAVNKYFLNEIEVNRIEARHDPKNTGSGKVMIKCGMQYEGTMRRADINNQGICDCAMYALLSDDLA